MKATVIGKKVLGTRLTISPSKTCNGLRKIYRFIVSWRERSRVADRLAEMDARTLNDIGMPPITRG